MDVCVRSNSVDSLRTAGHSRSVSHDSYFDLLQSPLRGIVNCPSRELSELGMNFDREEPEMRLFSESESLVSSPRIPKDHQNGGAGHGTGGSGHASRRVLRSRPDEFSNTASINPSPKKQPRLNIQSANAAGVDMANWGPMSMDESIMCKRYKLEDQLSDIQFIDCNTPEHHIGAPPNATTYSSTSSLSTSFNVMTKFNTNAQVHEPPTIVINKKAKDSESGQGLKSPLNRFSYPQYVAQNNNNPDHHVQIRYSDPAKKAASENDRFSYPGERREGNKRYGYQEDSNDDQSDSLVKSVMDHFNFTSSTNKDQTKLGISADPSQQSLQTIVTPSSPSQSLRYSLLASGCAGDTSSENVSEVGNLLTPGVMNPMETSVGSATKLIDNRAGNTSGHPREHHHLMMQSMEESELVDEHTRDINNEGDVIHDVELEKTFVDISALKRKFSLDLLAESPPRRSDIDKAQKTLNLSTPNTPNQTPATTTSQSATPSEFGYQHLNRMSNVGTPATPTEETSFMVGHEVSPQLMIPGRGKGSPTVIPGSPIKSTICITYNTQSPARTPPRTRADPVMKSPCDMEESSDDYEVIEVGHKTSDQCKSRDEVNVLETSFDEHMVYEQVKFFKSAVSAINDLVEDGDQDDFNSGEVTPKATNTSEAITIAAPVQIVPEAQERMISSKGSDFEGESDPVSIPNPDHLDDSLECDQNLSLYENVIVERPAAFYENVEVRKSIMQLHVADKELSTMTATPAVAVDVKVITETPRVEEQEVEVEDRPKGKFLVKQLATKFETSPVDPQPPFDFSKGAAGMLLRRDASSGAVNRPEVDRNRMTAPASGPVMLKNASSPRSIARSLDENAFVREFGSVKILDNFPSIAGGGAAGDQQENNQNSENINGRRCGGSEYAKPKSLNPPKKLPLLEGGATVAVPPAVSIVESCKAAIRSKDDPMSKSSPYLAQRITPTTENRISLIQSNGGDVVKDTTDAAVDDDKSTAGANPVQLRDCKLDRDRIERIKEERRHQLNEKFRSESFKGENDTIKLKSKSKTELRASEKGDAILHASSTLDRTTLRSKSKVDIAPREKDEERLKRLSGANNRSEEQLSWVGSGDRRSLLIQDRIRRVSEGKGAGGDNEVKDTAATNASWKLRNKFEKRSSSGNGLVATGGGVGVAGQVVVIRDREGGAVENIIQRNMEQQ